MLRPYQTDVLQTVQTRLAQHRRVVMVLPTGGGKTLMFSTLAQQTPGTVLILVHRAELLDQVSRTLTSLDVAHGLIAPNEPWYRTRRVQVASVQSLIRRLADTPKPDLVIIDEAHHCVTGNTWGRVCNAWPQALRLGVTATPCRLSGEGLRDLFDTMVVGPTTKQLIDDGYLSDYTIYAPPAMWTQGLHRRGGDYARDEASQAASKPTITGNAIAHYQNVAPGSRALVFTVSRQHAEGVRDRFVASGVRADLLDGTLDRATRRERVDHFTSGELRILVTVDLVSEGFDVPAVETIISLRPTQSLTLWLQQVGRGLRPYPGKPRATILDHAGNTLLHGLPDDEREWSLDGAEQRTNTGGKGINVRTCGQCFQAVKAPASVCPGCGYVFPVESRVVEEVSGELVELEKERVRRAQKREVGQARDLAALIAIEQQRGYKRGWAHYIWRARQAKKGVRQ